MEMKSLFFRASDEQFSFLRGYNFQPKIKKAEAGTYIRVYQNSTTAVEVALEWAEQYLYVRLCRLVDGKIHDNPVVVRPDSKLYCFNLENLLLLTEPSLIVKPVPYEQLTPEQVEKTLCRYAHAVEKYAAKVLQGDFEWFPRLEGLVKERAAQSASQASGSKQVATRFTPVRPTHLAQITTHKDGD